MKYIRDKHIPYYYLYDTKGSDIYNQITNLEEYYPFNKEKEILRENIEEILSFKDDQKTDYITLVEFGAGYSVKTEIVINKLLEIFSVVQFVPIDVSESSCNYTFEAYKSIERLKILPFIGTYDQYIEKHKNFSNRVIYLWLGSSIGNLTFEERVEFLSKVSNIMTFRDFFLIGFDTVYKNESIILNAYNDSKRVTANFMLNIVSHIKEKYNLNWEEEDFEYAPDWNREENRVEMYIRCLRDHIVKCKENNDQITLYKGDKIFIEYSHKFSAEQVEKESNLSNLTCSNLYFTNDKYFMFGRFMKSTKPVFKFTDTIFSEYVGHDSLDLSPIDLRNNFLFYMGHIYTFYDIKLFKLEENSRYFQLFERGKDPLVYDPQICHRHSDSSQLEIYPNFIEILDYIIQIRIRINDYILKNGYTYELMACLEHEMMHQETLFYMIRMTNKKLTISTNILQSALEVVKCKIKIPQRTIIQGTNESFSWDIESPQHHVTVPAFAIDNLPITWVEMVVFVKENMQILAKIPNLNSNLQIRVTESIFMDLKDCGNLPAWVNLEVAYEFIKWKNSKGINCRLMTEDEFDSLSSKLENSTIGNVGFKNLHATPVGFYADYSHDLVGELMSNGWELTSTTLYAFPGYKPMEIYPEYSSDFLSGKHFILKGAGPFTSHSLCRKSFRNWFQADYPFHTSKFRLAYDIFE